MTGQNRQLVVTRRLGWLGAAIMFVWAGGEIFSGHRVAVPLELGLAFLCLSVEVMIWFRAEYTARIVMLLVVNTVVLSGSILFPRGNGGELPLLALVSLPFIMFERRERISILFASTVPVALFVLCVSPLRERLVPVPLFPSNPWDYWSNVASTFVIGFLFAYFYIRASEQEESHRLKRIVDTSLIGVVLGKSTGEIVQMNSVLCEMLGYSSKDFKGGQLRLSDLVSPENRAAMSPGPVYEKECVHQDGRKIPVLMGIASLGEKESEDHIAFILDVSAQRSLKAWDEFAAVASHEMKTPLTTLSLQAEYLRKSLQNLGIQDDKLVRLIAENKKACFRMGRLVDQLLDFSRIRSGKLELQRADVNLVKVVEDVIQSFDAGGVGDGNLIFHSDGNCSGHWDLFRVEEIIVNLLSNAIKYGEGKPVHVSVSEIPQSNRVEFRVADHGIGIHPDEQVRIFEKFQRISSPHHAVAGLGLGLYIVRNLVEAHGGSIRVDSKFGEGATFIVKLPKLL